MKKYFSFICRVAHWHRIRVIVVIHDLMSLHRKRITLATELHRLGLADAIIASNEKMQQWLTEKGLQCPMTALGLFDYRDNSTSKESDGLTAETPTSIIPNQGGVGGASDSSGFSLVYAGALVMRKNAYLLELAQKAQHFDLHIYGNSAGLPGITEAPHAVCYPFTPADEFIRHADGDFGLVWDGDSLDTCQGDFGEYLRYNSPHKVSFYLRAGLPVIIWREAAVAPIIEHEGIGISIASIAEFEQRLPILTPAELQQMRQNVSRISARLASGQYFREALTRLQN